MEQRIILAYQNAQTDQNWEEKYKLMVRSQKKLMTSHRSTWTKCEQKPNRRRTFNYSLALFYQSLSIICFFFLITDPRLPITFIHKLEMHRFHLLFSHIVNCRPFASWSLLIRFHSFFSFSNVFFAALSGWYRLESFE